MDKQAFSSEEFARLTAIAVSNDPSAITIPFSAVILSGDGYKENYVELVLPKTGKTRMYVIPAFFKQLAKMLGIQIALKNRMDDKEFGGLLNALKVLQSSHVKTSEVTVVFDPIERKLTHISAGGYNRISNAKLFDFASALVTANPALQIVEVLGGENSSDSEIRILSSNEVALTGIVSDDSEDFQFGITLANRGTVTAIGDFAYRLVCSNGMMGIRSDDRFLLGGTTEDDMFQLFEHFENLHKAHFIPEDFELNVATASEVPASLNELMIAFNAISKGIVGEFDEQTAGWIDAMKRTHFPEIIELERKLLSRDIDPQSLSAKQMGFVKSDKSMWELINIVTNLGSNKTPYTLTNKSSLQKLGGSLLTRPFDLQDIHLLIL